MKAERQEDIAVKNLYGILLLQEELEEKIVDITGPMIKSLNLEAPYLDADPTGTIHWL